MPRRWTSEEVNDLVENVETHYEFLTSPLTNSKMKGMVDAKWLEITQRINALGAGIKLEVDKVKKKWLDTKSITKKAVAEYNKEVCKTGGVLMQPQLPQNCNLELQGL